MWRNEKKIGGRQEKKAKNGKIYPKLGKNGEKMGKLKIRKYFRKAGGTGLKNVIYFGDTRRFRTQVKKKMVPSL